MTTDPMRVLPIEDDPDDFLLLKETLTEASTIRIKLAHADRLSTALNHLSEQAFDIVLLDLNLPDSRGLPTLASVHAQAPQAPIVVLTGLDDEELAMKALQTGAQDYLVKGQVLSELLYRAIRYAIERQHLLEELETLWRIQKNLRAALLKLCEKERYAKTYHLIKSLPGIGWQTSIRLVLEWGEDLSRFTSGKKIASFLGLIIIIMGMYWIAQILSLGYGWYSEGDTGS